MYIYFGYVFWLKSTVIIIVLLSCFTDCIFINAAVNIHKVFQFKMNFDSLGFNKCRRINVLFGMQNSITTAEILLHFKIKIIIVRTRSVF